MAIMKSLFPNAKIAEFALVIMFVLQPQHILIQGLVGHQHHFSKGEKH
jgi:hypothetical protein